ncbi:zinc metalloprotease HtpX [Leptotrichia sp. oral taxon 879]|uniref:zinc metalloprotease HtpX n=1 Tax=Leptotrichia sp. oral taxon 879 TaxID=1227267 RepID=UPI00040BD266|nr:zinc metalloprotease HtpX [Leptotrichia sp. oral taxon 879]
MRFVALALSPIGEAIFRSMNGCREIVDSSILNRLTPLFNEIYEKAKLKDPNLSQNIKLYIVDQPYPNAFALGRNTVCVTNGLLHLDDAEIKGIFAHEFAHLSNKDTDIALFIYVGNLLASLMFLILRVILFIISFLMISFSESNSTYETYDAYGRRQRKKGGALKGFVLAAGLDMIYVAIIGLYTKLGIILVSHSSRNHEFAADKFAYNLGYGRELRDALVELQGEAEKPTGFVANLMATHPKTALRIEKLNMYLSGNFDDDLNKSIDEEPQTSNDKTDTADYNTSKTDYSSASSNDTASFNKEERKYSVDSNDTMRQPTINGVIFIDDDINSDKNINNIKNQKIINERTTASNTATFNKNEEKISSTDVSKQHNDTTFREDNSKKGSYEKIEDTKAKTKVEVTSSSQKNNDRIFYIGLFASSFIQIIPAIFTKTAFLLLNVGVIFGDKFQLYDLAISITYFADALGEVFDKIIYLFTRELYLACDIILILLSILIIIKLNKENRGNELKRINYLSAIVGSCMRIFIRIASYYYIMDLKNLDNLCDVILLISAITNGILIFKRKKNNKKY